MELASAKFMFPVIYFFKHAFPKNKFLNESQTNCSKIPARASDKVIHRIEIDRLSNLSEEDFINNYLNKNRPVVFNGQALNWDCCKNWNLDFIENKMNNISFRTFENINPHSGELPDYLSDKAEYISSKELAEAIQKKQAYLRFSTVMDEHRDLANYLDNTWLKKMRRGFFGVCIQNFIGAKGRKTTLHSGSTPFFYIMAFGEKKWNLTATSNTYALNPLITHHSYFQTDADLETATPENTPGLIGANIYYAHLKQGDILFVPSWMWHQVENLTDSWGVSYNFTALRTFLKYPLFVAVRIFFRQPSFLSTLMSTLPTKTPAKMQENVPEFFHD